MPESGVDIFAKDPIPGAPSNTPGSVQLFANFGHYKIYKVKNFGAGTYMDMTDGLQEEGNPIQGWSSNAVDEGNQGWKVIILDDNDKTIHLQNTKTGLYARAPSEIEEEVVVGSTIPAKLRLVETQTGVYQIKTTEQDFAFKLPDSQNGTQVRLAIPDTKYKDKHQKWIFQLISTKYV